MSMIRLCLISIVIANSCFAADDSTLLDKGQSAPFSGVLMSKSKAQTIRVQLLERDELKEKTDSLDKSIKLYKDIEDLSTKKINILTEENDKLAQGLKEAKQTSNFDRVIWFTLGVLATGFAFYGAKQVIK